MVSNNITPWLLEWYNDSHRNLPWREANDPYRIWVSEVMLQQTQVATVVPYYEAFLRRFPDLESLAAADDDAVMKQWEGLGYYARARNIHRAAVMVCETHAGSVPADPDIFRKLPGVGDYINAAVQSIAFGHPLAAVDGNVKRVLARLFAIDAAVNRAGSQRVFQAAADQLLDQSQPGDFNQAMMELGALVCRPRQPACDRCPLHSECRAFITNAVSEFPVRESRSPVPMRRVAVGVVEESGRFLITQRKKSGLLGGLWEFPGGKIESGESPESACVRELREEAGLDVEVISFVGRVRHAYTHFKVELDVFRCRRVGGEVVLNGPVDHRWIALEEIAEYAFPRANHKFIPLLSEDAPNAD